MAAGFILVMAAAVRFPHLSKSLHLDETWVVDLVQKGDLRPHTYQAPPLFHYILLFWSHIAGFGNAGGIVNGSIINYSHTPMTLSGNSDLYFNRSGIDSVPAGFVPEIVLHYCPESYSECSSYVAYSY